MFKCVIVFSSVLFYIGTHTKAQNCSNPLSCSPDAPISSSFVDGVVDEALLHFAKKKCKLGEEWPKNAKLKNDTLFDFIVVGAGTAGSLVAARLAEIQNIQVLLIEAGDDPPTESIIPSYRDALKGTKRDWNFLTMDEHHSSQALTDGRQYQPHGKMLGGTGSMNDMVYSRGFPQDYKDWANIKMDEETLGPAWDWPCVLEYFKKTEKLTDERIINNPELMSYHGTNGEIEVAGLNESTRETDIFLEAFKEIGFDIVSDMTYPNKIGAGRLSHTISKGQRASTATSLLNKSKGKITVLKNALVVKILIEENTKRAYGVKVLIDGKLYVHVSNYDVILSAGTFNTPKLLMLSGIGPRDHLTKLGIPVVKDLPVGDNLHDHVMVLLYLRVEEGQCIPQQDETYFDIIKYLRNRTGSLSRTNSMGALFSVNGTVHEKCVNGVSVNESTVNENCNNSTSNAKIPDFTIIPVCIPKGVPFYYGCTKFLRFKESICRKLGKINEQFELVSLAVILLKPKSRGRVRLNSTNYLDDPLIYSGTFNDESDLEGFPEAMKKAYSLARTRYFKGKKAFAIDFELQECVDLDDRNEKLKCQAKSLGTSAWHAVGTAAMGSVVDRELKVKGLEYLRVVDASVIPEIVRGNTNSPVTMAAEQAAYFIANSHRWASQLGRMRYRGKDTVRPSVCKPTYYR